ncbi:hypothetical protein PQX77_008400 [Marasmius sp. AFHP31]|nr:hypothetical protein PQX77_013013 [Marasmius sp. AFHP31]KAK1228535.1 hypothetical protein PQX77_008400 [Marasmius sp. AFHP31]
MASTLSSMARYAIPRRPPLAPIRLDSISEESSTDCELVPGLNLGAESPRSILNEEASFLRSSSFSSESHLLSTLKDGEDIWRNSGIAVNTAVPMRARNWRSSSFAEKQRKRPRPVRDAVDRDCGICFEFAVSPSRTLCCGKLFCMEHITHWLNCPESDGRCPSCGTLCNLENGILSLASPVLRSPPPSPAAKASPSSTPTSNSPISSSPSSATPGDQSPIPRTGSPEPIGAVLCFPSGLPKTTDGNNATLHDPVAKCRNSKSPHQSRNRARSSILPPFPSTSTSAEDSERRKRLAKEFHRNVLKTPAGTSSRSLRRHVNEFSSKSSSNCSVSPSNSMMVSPKTSHQPVIILQLPLVGHELALSYALCEVLSRTAGRVLSAVGLVVLFYALLA